MLARQRAILCRRRRGVLTRGGAGGRTFHALNDRIAHAKHLISKGLLKLLEQPPKLRAA
jgi:hypothetical protein